MREFRPMPTIPKAMRHVEKREGRFFRSEIILKPSHSANIREFRPMPTTPKTMKHFEKSENRLLRSEIILKPSHSRRKRRVPAPYSDTGVGVMGNTHPRQPPAVERLWVAYGSCRHPGTAPHSGYNTAQGERGLLKNADVMNRVSPDRPIALCR